MSLRGIIKLLLQKLEKWQTELSHCHGREVQLPHEGTSLGEVRTDRSAQEVHREEGACPFVLPQLGVALW